MPVLRMFRDCQSGKGVQKPYPAKAGKGGKYTFDPFAVLNTN